MSSKEIMNIDSVKKKARYFWAVYYSKVNKEEQNRNKLPNIKLKTTQVFRRPYLLNVYF